MKTVKRVSWFVMVMATLTMSVNAALTPPRHVEDQMNKGITVKAEWIDGVLMPVVYLPEVEIVGLKIQNNIVKGVIRNGEIVILSDLPEVEISEMRPKNHGMHPEITSDMIMNNDLPVVEITADFPLTMLHEAAIIDNAALIIVQLPEIEVIGTVRVEPYFASLFDKKNNSEEVTGLETPNAGFTFSMFSVQTADEFHNFPLPTDVLIHNIQESTMLAGKKFIRKAVIQLKGNLLQTEENRKWMLMLYY